MTKRVLAALVVFGCVALPTASPAQPAPSEAQPRTDILRLVSQTPAVEPDGDFVVRVRVIGAPSGAKLQLQVHDRLPTRSDFKASLTGRVSRHVNAPTVTVPATPDASGVVVATVPTRDVQSTLPSDADHVRIGEGVFPVSIDLISNTGAALDSLATYLIRMPQGRQFGPFGVAVVLPIGGPLAMQSDGSVRIDTATAQGALSTASVLESHSTVPLSLVPTGETLDALDPSTTAELRTAVTGKQVAAAPYVRVRPSEWEAAGLRSALSDEFDLGVRTTTAKIGAPDPSVYVADDGLTPAAAQLLSRRGVRNLVLADADLDPVDERLFNRTLTQPFNVKGVDGVAAVAADAGLRAHVGETGDPVLDASHLLADLAVLYFDDPPDKRAAVVSLPAGEPVDPQLLDALLAGLDPNVNHILQPMTLTTLFTTVPPAGSRGETNGRGTPLVRTLTSPPNPNLTTFASGLAGVENDLASYRGMVAADNPRPNEIQRRALVAGADQLSDGERVAYLDGARDAIRAETAKVQAPGRQTINFTARDGVVSLTLRNTTGYPVKIRLRLQGPKLEFPGHEDGNLDVTLTEETTRVPLNVHTRASGDSALDITLTAPDGRLFIGRTRITVRSTAFSGVGIVLSVGAGLFLAIWWLRHAIATRRERRRRLRHVAK